MKLSQIIEEEKKMLNPKLFYLYFYNLVLKLTIHKQLKKIKIKWQLKVKSVPTQLLIDIIPYAFWIPIRNPN